MPSFGSTLAAKDIQDVAAYIAQKVMHYRHVIIDRVLTCLYDADRRNARFASK